MATQTASQYLDIAQSYLEDVDRAYHDIKGDPKKAMEVLDTLRRAEVEIEKARKVDPTADEDFRRMRALILGRRGAVEALDLKQRARGLALMRQSIEIDEEQWDVQANMSRTYVHMGDKALALRHIRRAIELNPENIDLRKSESLLEDANSSAMHLGAFRGSWKVLLVLVGVAVIGVFGAITEHGGTGVVVALLFGAAAAAYWVLKSR